jgi:hypothetical protein
MGLEARTGSGRADDAPAGSSGDRPGSGTVGIILDAGLAATSANLLLGGGVSLGCRAGHSKRKLPIELLKTVIRRSVPWLQLIEPYIRPDRLNAVTGRSAEALIEIPRVAHDGPSLGSHHQLSAIME